jgi:hypothetical protein
MLQSFEINKLVLKRKNIILRKLKHLMSARIFKVLVTNMRTGDVVEFKYKTKKAAYIRFVESCQELGYSYTEVKSMNIVVAGGVDHEFRLELIEVQ